MSSSASNWWQIDAYAGGGTSTATTTASTSEAALAKGGGRYLFTSLTSNAYIKFGVTGMAAASTSNFDICVPAGGTVCIFIPDSITYMRVIADASGSIAWGKVGN